MAKTDNRNSRNVQAAKTKRTTNRQKQIVERLDKKHKMLYNNKHKNTLSTEVHKHVRKFLEKLAFCSTCIFVASLVVMWQKYRTRFAKPVCPMNKRESLLATQAKLTHKKRYEKMSKWQPNYRITVQVEQDERELCEMYEPTRLHAKHTAKDLLRSCTELQPRPLFAMATIEKWNYKKGVWQHNKTYLQKL